jgi:hypothetical protein
VCDALAELRKAMGAWTAPFDAALFSAVDATTVVADAAAIEYMAATVKALAAARVAETGYWRERGARSAADDLARTTGISVSEARETLNVGRRLASQPQVAAAARAGKLSSAQARAVTDAVEADPSAEEHLLERARGLSLRELIDECARVKAAAVDAESRRAQVRAGRRLRSWTDAGGVWHLHAQGNAEDGAQVMSALAPITDEIFAEARGEGRREPVEAYSFDALIRMAIEATSPPGPEDQASHDGDTADSDQMTAADDNENGARGSAGYQPGGQPNGNPPESRRGASRDGPDETFWADEDAGGPDSTVRAGGTGDDRDGGASRAGRPSAHRGDVGGGDGPTGGTGRRRAAKGVRRRRGAPVKLLLRVDYDCFLRGFPVDGETCELVGYGPVSVSAVRDLVAMGDAFVAAILTRGKGVVGVAHLGRRPNAHQRTALEWMYPACAVRGCPAQARLEFDHRIDWSMTHVTMLDTLDRLCEHHHDLKTRCGWALVKGTTKRPFVAPDDPRHPRRQPSTA